MKLRNRSLLILGLIFFIFFMAIALVSLSVTLSGLDRIEYQDMTMAAGQVRSALDSESASLLGTTQDWAWWDEMAAFTQSPDPDFIDRNARPEHFATIRVHLFVILDSRGNVVHSILLSPDYASGTSAPPGVLAIVRNTSGLTSLTETDPGNTGLIRMPGGPMILASAPVLLSDKNGPVRGTVIMGRYLEHGPLQKIGTLTGYTIHLTWPEDGERYQNLPETVRSLPGGDAMAVMPENESMMTEYTRIPDLTGGHPVLAVTQSRELYRTGFDNIVTYLSLLVVWAVVTGIIMVIVMDRVVLQRIDLLSQRVQNLPAGKEDVQQPVLSGNDELATLERIILDSRADLVVRERQLRAFINALPDPAALYSRDGVILLANTAFAQTLGKAPDDLVGTPAGTHLPADDYEVFRQQAREAIRRNEVVQCELEVAGKTLMVSHYPIADSEGEVIQVGLLSVDISERKRLENALQRVTKKITLLNTIIFTDIQNKIFVQRGYQELLRKITPDEQVRDYLEREEAAVKEIQSSLQFARQYNDMGANPPRWQNAQEVLLFAISHLDPGNLQRQFRLGGLEIYADPLLERVFFSLVENTLRHAPGATVIRAWYHQTDAGLVITFEDNGPGIPAADKERIFTKGQGSSGGVGLFLSREILSITGISITENGEPGKGARFELLVPPGEFRLFGK